MNISELEEKGVTEDKVFFESFSKGGTTKGDTKPVASNSSEIDSAEIVCTASGKTLTWQKGNGTILDFIVILIRNYLGKAKFNKLR